MTVNYIAVNAVVGNVQMCAVVGRELLLYIILHTKYVTIIVVFNDITG